MAQGFQESSLNNDARSPYGAVGIMQVLPSTAKWIGVSDYEKIERNIHAGAKYMAKMMKRYEKDPKVSPKNRFLFALAAYNAGPGNMRKYRKRAVKYGYDPNQWFGNVERVALRSGNLESVMYVRNILNYTLAYKSAYEQSLRRADLKGNRGKQ
jgi:membrane-bound lytic murein transglycosylase MltF